ncbi:MAG: hypothetical protein KBT35_07280, partial [Firmicutes bacterium]|nr:hypothetical protein [Candidatus Colivicinus equi]
MSDVKELKEEEIEKVASGLSIEEEIKIIKERIERLERQLLIEDDPKERALLEEDIARCKRIIYELTR